MIKDHPIKKEIDRAVKKFDSRKYSSPEQDVVLRNFIYFASGLAFGFATALSFVGC